MDVLKYPTKPAQLLIVTSLIYFYHYHDNKSYPSVRFDTLHVDFRQKMYGRSSVWVVSTTFDAQLINAALEGSLQHRANKQVGNDAVHSNCIITL